MIERRDWVVRYSFALAAVGAGVLLRMSFTRIVGPNLATYITFYPMIMVVALVAGFGPGLLATASVLVAVDYWFISPGYILINYTPVELLGQVIFTLMGVFMTYVAGRYRQVRDDLEGIVTERTEGLRAAADRLNRSQEIARLGSWELDLVKNKLSWSDEVYRIFGLMPQEFAATYEAFLAAVHPDDRAAVDFAYSDSLREGRDCYDIEHRIVRKSDGHVRHVHEKCNHIYDATGKVIKSVGMIQDITERKLSEETIKRTELEWQRTFNAISDSVFIQDKDFRIVRANKATLDLLGLPEKEVMGKRCFELFHKSSGPWANCPLERTREDREPHTEEVHDPGIGIPLLVTTSPIFDDAGELEGSVHIAKNITGQKEAEELLKQTNLQLQKANETMKSSRLAALNVMEDAILARDALRKSEEYLSTVFRTSPVGIFITRLNDGLFIDVNEAYLQIIGYSAEEVIGSTTVALNLLADPEDRERILSLIANQGKVTGFEIRFRRKGGEIAHMLVSALPLERDGEQCILGTLTDISERKRAEEQRERFLNTVQQLSSEAQKRANDLEAVFESMTEPMIIYDMGGKVTNHNPEAAASLGFDPTGMTPAEVMGKGALKAGEGEPLKAAEFPADRALRGESTKDLREILKTPNGEERITLTNAAPIILRGKLTGAIVTWYDITEMERLKQIRDRMLRNLSHQLKTPLAVIDMSMGLLIKDGKKSDNELESMDMLRRNTRQMKELVEKILKLSRLESGGEKANLTRFDLAKAVSEEVADLMSLAREKQLQLAYDGPVSLEVSSDREKVLESVTNLVENAIKYTDEGRIDVSLKDTASEVTVKVSDTGVGLSSKDIEYIFRAFYKVDPSVPGAGVGLNIVLENMKLVGGSIAVESPGPGKGSAFKLTIPKVLR